MVVDMKKGKILLTVSDKNGSFVTSRLFTSFQSVVNYINCGYYNIVNRLQVYTISFVDEDEKSEETVID